MRSTLRIETVCALLVVPSVASGGAEVSTEAFGYTLTTNIVYGIGEITVEGEVVERDLPMDVYRPSNSFPGPRPAVILLHGGAFHRGGLRQPAYREAGAVHGRMEDYARLLTPLGYICFVVDYRLAWEHPVARTAIDDERLLDYRTAVTDAAIARTNYARSRMNLPPLNEGGRLYIWRALLSAAEDLDTAVRHVKDNAKKYGVDPDRIAAGGHSAGATIVLNAAYGLGTPVKAIFPLSPAVTGFDFDQVVDANVPSTLIVIAQYDDPAISEGFPKIIRKLEASGADYEFAWVPAFPHFYPTGAISLGSDATRVSVGERIINFLGQKLNIP